MIKKNLFLPDLYYGLLQIFPLARFLNNGFAFESTLHSVIWIQTRSEGRRGPEIFSSVTILIRHGGQVLLIFQPNPNHKNDSFSLASSIISAVSSLPKYRSIIPCAR